MYDRSSQSVDIRQPIYFRNISRRPWLRHEVIMSATEKVKKVLSYNHAETA